MPLFGLLPYGDEEERRRRLAEQGLADTHPLIPPGINPGARQRPQFFEDLEASLYDSPAPARLPNIPAPRPLPPPPGVPGGAPSGPMPGSQPRPDAPAPRGIPMHAPTLPDMADAPLPEFRPRPITRTDELSGAKDEFMGKTPGRLKSGLLNALRGFASGVSTGGGLGAGLGGAVAGGAFGAINPRGARERQFETEEKPKIFERFGMEDRETAARRAAEAALREEQRAQADLQNIQSQIGSRGAADALNQSKFDFERGKPTILSPGQVALGPNNAPVFTAPDRPRPADEAAQIEAALTDELGTVEEQSQGSLRGRTESLKQRLTPDEQRLVFGGATRDDDPQTVARAQAKWQKIQEDELGSIRRDTGERRKAKVTQRRLGRKGQPSGTGITRSRSEFNSSKYPGARFD